jgi:hypothetical protein
MKNFSHDSPVTLLTISQQMNGKGQVQVQGRSFGIRSMQREVSKGTALKFPIKNFLI